MDYGKEAYRKAALLEEKEAAGGTVGAAGAVFDGACPAETLTTVAEYAGGAALLSLTVTSEGAGVIGVYYNGAKAGDVAAGGTHTFSFAAAGPGAIALLPPDGTAVGEVAVSALGLGCSFAGRTERIAADAAEGRIYAAASGEELTVFEDAGGGFAAIARFPASADFDLAADGGRLAVAFVSERRTGCIAVLGGGGIAASRYFAPCARLAVAYASGGLTAAVYDGKAIYVLRLDDDLNVLSRVRAHNASAAERVALVKGAAAPALAVEEYGRILARDCADEVRAEIRVPLGVLTAAEEIKT